MEHYLNVNIQGNISTLNKGLQLKRVRKSDKWVKLNPTPCSMNFDVSKHQEDKQKLKRENACMVS